MVLERACACCQRSAPCHPFCSRAGEVSPNDVVHEYGVDADVAVIEAGRYNAEILHAGQLSVAPGEVIGGDDVYLCHRATASSGSSGSALRCLDQPQLLHGTHLGGAGGKAGK